MTVTWEGHQSMYYCTAAASACWELRNASQDNMVCLHRLPICYKAWLDWRNTHSWLRLIWSILIVYFILKCHLQRQKTFLDLGLLMTHHGNKTERLWAVTVFTKGTGRITQPWDEARLLVKWGEAGSQSWLVRLFSSFCLSSSVKASGKNIFLWRYYKIFNLQRVKMQSNNNQPLYRHYHRSTGFNLTFM